ncbi:uncharacterized protein PHACADRAFT_188294 [Phanerochaete carnosa HHB-10118-sp]|uniref:Uncharacterized protein n=1 Tax=Phanerochaete carnosa (strain HHB-10118-sp) TaxID=650164 RepID=K5WKR2_PHACS|nr:uncharacterized protein PHACADRAFT_188294 [Phanerochaete carnosa HHB-10118-sp]EKM50822.1 hypothetical protein PHACADRAFT_188294 [Phanerochaete carnosa HHB-10118-sp]
MPRRRTVHGAVANGSTVTFPFNGTGITFFGTVSVPSPGVELSVSSFVMDSDTPNEVLVTAPLPTETMYHHAWYTSPPLRDGPHTLVVTALNTNANDIIWFDYLEYVPSEASPVSPVSPSPPSSATITSTGSVGGPVLQTSAPSNSSATPSALPIATHKAADLGTILPAALVPATVLSLLLGVFFLRCRRRREGRHHLTREHALNQDDPCGSAISGHFYVVSAMIGHEAALGEAYTATAPISTYTLMRRPMSESLFRGSDGGSVVLPTTYATSGAASSTVGHASEASGTKYEEGPPAYGDLLLEVS